MKKPLRRAILVASALVVLAVGLAIALGARRGEVVYAAYDGVYAIDIDRLRIVARAEGPHGVRDLLRLGDVLWVAAADGLHELDARTLAHRRTISAAIFDALAPGLGDAELLALEHPGDNPKEAHGFHQLRRFDLASGALLGSWRLPPDAHDLVRPEGSALVYAPRQVGRAYEVVDLRRPEAESVTHIVPGEEGRPELALAKAMVPASGGQGIYLFEGELQSPDGATRSFELVHLGGEGQLLSRQPVETLAGYPRRLALVGTRLYAACGAEIVCIDVATGEVVARSPSPERDFALMLDGGGGRLLAARPIAEASRGMLAVYDPETLQVVDRLPVPTAVAELGR